MSKELIETIRETSKRRQQIVAAQSKLTLQIKAICRGLCDGDKSEAGKLYKALIEREDDPRVDALMWLSESLISAHDLLETKRAALEKELTTLAGELPVAPWVLGIRGAGLGGLALIVGEAGDLSSYSGPAKLWKRMGLAVIDGERQRAKAGVSQEEALVIGYNPRRRSVVWNIGDSLLKAQSARVDKETGEVKREAGEYRKLYDERKKLEAEKDPTGRPAAHHARAKRYVEKRYLRELWVAWRNPPKVEPEKPAKAKRRAKVKA